MKTILITNNSQKGFQEALDVTLEQLENREVRIVDVKFSSSSAPESRESGYWTEWSALILFSDDKVLGNG